MLEADFVREIETTTTEGRISWEKLNPSDFNPPCSYRAELMVNGKRIALNVYEGIMRVFDDVGLVVETKVDLKAVENAIDTACKAREPGTMFESIAAAIKKIEEPKIIEEPISKEA